ncbi:MAG: PEP-utilizing enzyme [Dehalococcoidia bacterium]
MTTPEGQPLPVPSGFPVQWPDTAMEALHWSWDQMHHPHPKTPLSATFEAPAFAQGASLGFQQLQIPMDLRVLILNGYWYGASEFAEPSDSFPPPWWPNVEQEFVRRVPTMTQTWEQEYLPEVQAINQRLRDFDYGGASTQQLLDFIDEAYRMRVRAWELHMIVVLPVMGAASRFGELYEQLLGKPTRNEPFLMLQGFENKSVESGKALWELSRQALREPTLAKLIEETPAHRLPEALQATASGSELWAAFLRYLDSYGWRSDAFELADSAWAEDPAIPLATLQGMLKAPDDHHPALQEERCREERASLEQEAFARLDGHEGRPIFELLLRSSQQYVPIQENHNFYIDQMNTVLLRLPFLELGRRLAESGALSRPEDIFYLERDELQPASTQPPSSDWAARVLRRRADRERWAQVVPPRELGTPPASGTGGNPWNKLFFGERPEPSQDPKVITGIGASAGTVTATARVVHSLAEAGKLQPGDVLVCEMTLPAWTPLFASLSAVVADSGGVLSHCAIVAREYRIPCVVGTQVGTQQLKDGQRVTVDGAQGLVRING